MGAALPPRTVQKPGKRAMNERPFSLAGFCVGFGWKITAIETAADIVALLFGRHWQFDPGRTIFGYHPRLRFD
jgi:hypothetical protein